MALVSFADKLRELLKRRNMKAADLARKTKLSEATISNYLSGAKEPRLQNLQKIASALGISINYLTYDSSCGITKWQNTLQDTVSSTLLAFFTRYNMFVEQNSGFDLSEVVDFSILGSLNKIIDNIDSLLEFLEDANNFDNLPEVEKKVREYLGELADVNIGGYRDRLSGWDERVDSISDFEIQMWLLGALENNIPGYKEYRDMQEGDTP